MAKTSFLLSLVTVLFALFSPTVGDDVTLDQLFTVQPGTSNGGCNNRRTVLDQWHEEAINSLDVAIVATQNWLNDVRVRESMDVFFGINKYATYDETSAVILAIEQNIQYVLNFFNYEKDGAGNPRYDRKGYWLFCGSDFLVEKARTDTAKDKDNKDIKDKDGDPVAIQDIDAYLKLLNEHAGNKPWWAGDNTAGLNGYYFTDKGRTYCNGAKTLGGTAAINIAASATVNTETAAIILCPKAFDGVSGTNPPVPDSYREANLRLTDDYNLANALPKSTTLVHEMFHALRGREFLSGKEEEYDIIEAGKLAGKDPRKAQQNPESYVFFIAHMFHLFGPEDGTEPWSIPKNWDFRIIDGGTDKGDKKNMVFGAKVPGPADIDPDP